MPNIRHSRVSYADLGNLSLIQKIPETNKVRSRMTRLFASLVLLACCILPNASFADNQNAAFHNSFGELPILHEGRIKPLSSFAGIMLRHLHGKPSYNDQNANQWLAAILLAPDMLVEKPFFKIKDKRLLQALNIESSPSKHYSLMQLYPALQARSDMIDSIGKKDRNSLTKREAGLLNLTDKVSTFLQLSEAFNLIRPITPQPSEPLLDRLGMSERLENCHLALVAGSPANCSQSKETPQQVRGDITYLTLLSHRHAIDTQLKKVIAKKSEDISRYSLLEKELAGLSFQLAAIDGASQNNDLLRILPTNSQEWVTPWQLVREGKGNPENIKMLDAWKSLLISYQLADITTATTHLGTIQKAVVPHVGEVANTLELEALYHAIPWKKLAIISYIAISLLCLFHARIPRFNTLAAGLAILGFASHTLGIALRMLILERPPVSTLYESVLFVAWVAALTGLLFFWRSKQRESLLVGALLGAGLLIISPIYVEGDSLEMLVAVLNTNIWLATHVVIITMGYGASVMAGSLAHVHLWRMGKRNCHPALVAGSPAHRSQSKEMPQQARHDNTQKPNVTKNRAQQRDPAQSESEQPSRAAKTIMIILIIAAMLTTVGTILGGIWADQSWGRFWGWDPKENGALLIVLWIVWLLHARITKQLSERLWYGLLAFLNAVVAVSWFGVNLLGVGLHSYGFTESAVYGLTAFCLGELFVIGFLVSRVQN